MYKYDDFEIQGCYSVVRVKGTKKYLHSDGSILGSREYWPTKEMAEEILEKYYPKPKHVWEHGDVFKTRSGNVMIYLDSTICGSTRREPEAWCISDVCGGPSLDLIMSLKDATFLFNIKDEL